MIYLSRLIFDPSSSRVRLEVSHPYELHRSIMRAFPSNLAPRQERVLWRLESDSPSGDLALLVQSWTAPDWAWAQKAKGYLRTVEGPNPAVKQVDLAARLVAGQVLAFRLLANPTVKKHYVDRACAGESRGARYNGTRVGIADEASQIAWLRKKGETGGFRPVYLRVSAARRLVARGGDPDDPQRMEFLAVRFDGTLNVTDPAVFWNTVRNGVGSGKGLGFGLLSLARASWP